MVTKLLKHDLKKLFNPLTPNDPYRGCTTSLTSKRCILYIYSTNIGTEYFKHGIYSPFFSLQNAICFIILKYLVPVLFTFYIQGVLKLKKNSDAKRLMSGSWKGTMLWPQIEESRRTAWLFFVNRTSRHGNATHQQWPWRFLIEVLYIQCSGWQWQRRGC